jgi:hypothetical protein
MAYRKFFYGDAVAINHERYPVHTGHRGMIAGTRIKVNSDVTYSVDCECGKRLMPKASHMDLVTTPSESRMKYLRMKYFLKKIGITPKESQLEKQVGASLGHLKDRDRTLLVKRFGLEENTKTTHREIGEEFGITRARVQHLEKSLVKKLQR